MIALSQPSCHNRLKSLNSFSVSLLDAGCCAPATEAIADAAKTAPNTPRICRRLIQPSKPMLAAETASIYHYLSAVQPPEHARTYPSRGRSMQLCGRYRKTRAAALPAGDFVADPRSSNGGYPTWRPPLDPGCAKTRAFNFRVESSSQFGQSENQKCW
jgi:hypothetical protein